MDGLNADFRYSETHLHRWSEQTLLDGVLITRSTNGTVADKAGVLDARVCDMHVAGQHIVDLMAKHRFNTLHRGFEIVVHIAVDADICLAEDAEAAD